MKLYQVLPWSTNDLTYVHTDCIVCHGIDGAFVVGEQTIRDPYDVYVWHIRCAPARVRALALYGTIVRALRAVMGIDTPRRT